MMAKNFEFFIMLWIWLIIGFDLLKAKIR